MSDSNDEFVTIVGKSRTPKAHGTMYQIRMEVMLSRESRRINMAGILTEVVKRANLGNNTVRFLDVNKVPFTAVTVPSGKEFIERLAFATVESGKTRKMVLGFYMESKLLMLDIKLAININWLAQQKIFLRPHRMPFNHGTDLFLIGYITQEHPTTVNFEQLEAIISKKWYDPDQAIDSTMQDNDTEEDGAEKHTDYNDLIAALNTKGLIQNGALQIPITTERSFLKVTSPSKPAFEVNILSVYDVPRKHKDAATLLNDFSINANNDLSLVPFSLSKANSEQFYHQMCAHAKFLHDHRNICIFSVPKEDYGTIAIAYPATPPEHDNMTPPPTATLAEILQGNPHIHRIYPRHDDGKIQLSVLGVDLFYQVCAWIDSILPQFSYNPHWFSSRAIPASHSHTLLERNGPRGPKKNKYQDKFAIPDTGPPAFDPTTLVTPRSRTRCSNHNGNAWSNGPPIEIYYDPTETMVFPPLNDTTIKEHGEIPHTREGYGHSAPTDTRGRGSNRAGRGGYGRTWNPRSPSDVPYQVPIRDTHDQTRPLEDAGLQPNPYGPPAGNNQPPRLYHPQYPGNHRQGRSR